MEEGGAQRITERLASISQAAQLAAASSSPARHQNFPASLPGQYIGYRCVSSWI